MFLDKSFQNSCPTILKIISKFYNCQYIKYLQQFNINRDLLIIKKSNIRKGS